MLIRANFPVLATAVLFGTATSLRADIGAEIRTATVVAADAEIGTAIVLVASSEIGTAIAMAEEAVARGEYLIHAGGCVTCHTMEGDNARLFAGGRPLESPFGTFYSPNITPDTETGIGGWTDDDFVRAFWEGVSPRGEHYFPAFPYTAYTGVRADDLLAMKAYLFSREAVAQSNREHDLSFPASSRLAAAAWKSRYFEPGRFQPDPEKTEQWNRGAYLVRHLGHCGECHTPRTRFGALQDSHELQGNPDGPGGETVPNITADPEDGIGDWSLRDIEYFLDIGMLPDGDFTGGAMAEVIEDSTSPLTEDDRLAIATYLKSLH
ncbi:MAG: cytochrome c [Woeseia sp.]